MAAIAKVITQEILGDETKLSMEDIGVALNFFGKKHTSKRLIQILSCLKDSDILDFDPKTNTYQRAV